MYFDNIYLFATGREQEWNILKYLKFPISTNVCYKMQELSAM